MKSINVFVSIVCVLTSFVSAQTPSKTNNADALQKQVLLTDLKSLAVEIPKLDGPLARALANAEIADAAWSLDQSWARSLLKEAYRLTYPTEEEQRRIGPEPPGTPPRPPTPIGRARDEVRRRILSVARKDKVFADQLIVDSSSHVTKDDRQMMYAQLTRVALDEGDYPSAIQSIQQNMAIDPTQLMLVQLVNELAIKDRAAADKLIIEFIANLATAQLANGKLGRARGDIVLRWLVFPNSFFPDPTRRVPNPGPEVMKSYVRYVLETLTAVQQMEPGSLPRERSFLLSAWLPLNQYAPELRESFMQLEATSRTPGKDASLPTRSNEELDQEDFTRKQREALNGDGRNEPSIDLMITQEDFETARRLIDRLPDGERKTRLTEQANTKQAISLAKKGDLLAAQNLAERLITIGAILEVYPLIVERYASDKDQMGASAAVQSAMKQLKGVKSKPPTPSPPFGMPSEFMPTTSERDGVVSTLGKLANAVLPIDTLLGAQVVDEMVETANRSQLDTTQGRTGFDSELFKNLAARDEIRARAAADNFKDRLRKIVAMAGLYQWKAKDLERRTPKKAVRPQ